MLLLKMTNVDLKTNLDKYKPIDYTIVKEIYKMKKITDENKKDKQKPTPKLRCRCYINATYKDKTVWRTGKLPKPCPIHESHIISVC